MTPGSTKRCSQRKIGACVLQPTLVRAHKHNHDFIRVDDMTHTTAVVKQLLGGDSCALKFNLQTFELQSIGRMAQCTLRTDLIPGVGP